MTVIIDGTSVATTLNRGSKDLMHSNAETFIYMYYGHVF